MKSFAESNKSKKVKQTVQTQLIPENSSAGKKDSNESPTKSPSKANSVSEAREQLKRRYSQGNRNSTKIVEKEDSPKEEETPEPAQVHWNHTVKKSLTAKDLEKYDMSTAEGRQVDLKAEMEKYLGGDDEVLAGFYEDDDDSLPSFDSLNPMQGQQKSIFGRLTGALGNIVGNKQLTREDMDPILRQFA
jgi:hypothetical protein